MNERFSAEACEKDMLEMEEGVEEMACVTMGGEGSVPRTWVKCGAK